MNIALYDIRINGELDYVGITVDPKRRKKEHGLYDDDPDCGVFVVVEVFTSMKQARAAEKARICLLEPRRNKMHVSYSFRPAEALRRIRARSKK